MIVNTLHAAKAPKSGFQKHQIPAETVVIGAGLSKSFGLPLADELLPQMIDWHRSRNAIKLDIIFDFLEFFYPAFKRAGQWFPLAEDVLGMLDIADAYAQIRRGKRHYRWGGGLTTAIRIRFNRLLGEYLWHFQNKVIDSSQDRLESLRKFVSMRGTKVVYVTFNYDLLLETALSAEGIPYCYAIDRLSDSVTVLKPHGSINWFIKTIATTPSHAIKGFDLGESITVSETLDPNILHFRKNNWKNALLVAPSPNKQIQIEELRRVWTAFSFSINSVPNITIVGYSLPMADRLARLVLNRAGHSATRKIVVVNPGHVRHIYNTTISPNCIFIEKGFNEWLSGN